MQQYSNMKFTRPASVRRCHWIVSYLFHTPATRTQLAKMMNSAEGTAGDYLRYLHDQGLVRITHWVREPVRNIPEAVWGLGGAPHAPKPRPMTAAERRRARRDQMRARRRRLRADPEAYLSHLRHDRLARHLARAPRRDPFVAAFFGE